MKRFDFRLTHKKDYRTYCAFLAIDDEGVAHYMEACQGHDDIDCWDCSVDEIMEYLINNCEISQVDHVDNITMIEYIEGWLLEKQAKYYDEIAKNQYANVEDAQMLITLKGGNN